MAGDAPTEAAKIGHEPESFHNLRDFHPRLAPGHFWQWAQ